MIRALARHDIGYHSNFHSIQPPPALYLRDIGWLDGAAEFEARETGGSPTCAEFSALRRAATDNPAFLGAAELSCPAAYGNPCVPGRRVARAARDQPFWFAGMLHVFGMGRYLIRPSWTASRVDEVTRRVEPRGNCNPGAAG